MRGGRPTDYSGIPEIAPPGQVIPKGSPAGMANKGSGSTEVFPAAVNPADKWAIQQQIFAGDVLAPTFGIKGGASRWVGVVSGKAPVAGNYLPGDWVLDEALGGIWTCVVGGSPGVWIPATSGMPYKHQTATPYTPVLGDMGFVIGCDTAGAFALNLPSNAAVPYPVGTVIRAVQIGAGQVTVGVVSDTIHAPNGFKTAHQFSFIQMWKYASTLWILSGDTIP